MTITINLGTAGEPSRAIRYPVGDTRQTILPDAATRAGQYLAFDAEGDVVTSAGTGADAGLRTALADVTGADLVGTDFGALDDVLLGLAPGRFVSTESFAGGDIGARFNAAVAAVKAARVGPDTWVRDVKGIVIPPGEYEQTTQMLVDTVNNLVVSAYGASIVNATGSFASLKLIAARRCIFQGLQFNLRNNNNPDECIWIAGQSWWTHFKDCGVMANTTNSDFAAVRMQQGDIDGLKDDDRNKGNFWVTFSNLWARKFQGPDTGDIPTVIDAQGCQNALRVVNSSFNNFGDGIKIRNQNGSASSFISNDVQVLNTAFEGYTGDAIIYTQDVVSNVFVAGGAAIGCRFENGGGVARSTLTTVPSAPFMVMGSTVISSMTNYLSDAHASKLGLQSLDAHITPSSVSPRLVARNETVIGSIATGDTDRPSLAVIAKPQTNGGAISIRRFDGTIDGRLSQRPGGGMDIDGGAANILRLSDVQSLSGNSTYSNNFRGTAANPGSGTTIAVTFGTAEPDASYQVICTGDQDRYFWVTSKTTAGFTINTNTAFTGAGTTAWLLFR